MQDYIKWHIIREWFRLTNLSIENLSKTIKILSNTLEKMKQTSRSFQLLRKTPPSAQNSPSLVVSSAGTHGKIQLNRPEALNAVNNDMINEIRRGLNRKFLKFHTIFSSKFCQKPMKVMLLKILNRVNQ